jgi:hypothetical protein
VCAAAAVRAICRDQQAGMPVLLPEGNRGLRALRPGQPAGGALARGPRLRPVLHRGAAPQWTVRQLRPAAAPGRPARPSGDDLR